MTIRDRIKQFRRVPARELRPNPANWRVHPSDQQEILRAVLDEIGYADALLARELPDGSLELIDGHLRAEISPDQDVPVLILDLDQSEADKLLAVRDPLSAMAQTDANMLGELLGRIETENQTMSDFLNQMLADAEKPLAMPEPSIALTNQSSPPEKKLLSESYQVVVQCRDEDQQRVVYDRMTAEGFSCRLLTL